LFLDSSLKIFQRIIFLMLHDFLPDKSACEKAMLHTNGAKRRRVLKGEKLEVHGPGISTRLSTFVLKS